jgi:hypothetical protein
MSVQLNLFDKTIAEIRAVQTFNQDTYEALEWAIEYRFTGETNWNPVKINFVPVKLPPTEVENTNEPEAGN